jgi:outer membrane protein TolC
MNKRNISFLTCVLAVLFSIFTASAWADEALTFDRAVEIALKQNPDILSIRQEQVKASGAVDVARGAFLPSVSIGSSYTLEEETSSGSDDDSYSGSITVSETLYAGGKYQAYKKEAQLGVGIADSSVANVEETVIYDLYSLFYDVLLGKENVKTAEDALSYAENYVEEMKKRQEVGLATSLEVTRAEKLLVTSRKNLVSAKNSLESSKVSLFELLKLQDGQFSSVEGDLSYTSFTGDQQASLTKAMEQRPDLKTSRGEVEVQKQEIRVAQSGLRPTVSISGSWEYDDPATTSSGEYDEWSASVNIDFPVFDSGITKGYVAQERATLEQAKQAVIANEEAVRAEVAKAYLDLDTTAKTVEEARKNLELAKESLRLAEVGYREGVGIQLDVLDARSELTDARTLYSEAVRDHELALAYLFKVEGGLVNYSLKREG